MANADEKPTLKITLEDLDKVTVASNAPQVLAGGTSGARQYGNIAEGSADPVVADEGKSKFYLQGWFYLGAAGLLGALMAWAICEPAFVDGQGHRWGNWWVIPMVVAFMCLGFGVAESMVERSVKKAMVRGGLALLVGVVAGIIFNYLAGFIYLITEGIVYELGVRTNKNPAFWIARGIAWMIFGVAGGLVYGVVDRSGKKIRFGILGGIIGAGLGGMIFDPIALLTNAGAPSRAVGFGMLGLATGVAMGIVESALKDRWLYVASGPLAGKQFILYKPLTILGSSQQNDIYLFKDTTILPQHASIELRGAQTFIQAAGPVYVSGQPVKSRALRSGDLIQLGRYAFHFREKQR